MSGVRAPRVLLSVIAATTAGVLPTFLTGGLSVQLRADLGFSETVLGAIVSASLATSALASMSFGHWIEARGSTASMRTACLIGAASLSASALAPAWPVLAVTIAAGGLANALAQPASNALVVESVPPRRHAGALGVKQAAIPTATLLAGLAVPALALTVGWRWAYGAGALLALGAAAAVPRIDSPRRTARTASSGRGGDLAVGALVVLAVGLACGSAVANSFGAFVTSGAVEAGLSEAAAGTLLAASSALGITVRLVVGWLGDRIPHRAFRVVAAMIVGGGIGALLLARGTGTSYVIGSLVAFGSGWAWPGLFNFGVVAAHRHAPARATSVTQVGAYAGGALGPLAFGAIASGAGYRAAWTIAALVALTAAIVVTVGARSLAARTAEPRA
ncbi:MAG: MFS transporter [Actinomycetota bacterium]|nr:MFS transporter [Actinomycetota bacterium]